MLIYAIPLYVLTGALVWAIYTLVMRARDALERPIPPVQVTWSGDVTFEGAPQPDFARVTQDLDSPAVEIAEMQRVFSQIDPMDGVIPYVDNDWAYRVDNDEPIDQQIIGQGELFNNLLGIGDDDV